MIDEEGNDARRRNRRENSRDLPYFSADPHRRDQHEDRPHKVEHRRADRFLQAVDDVDAHDRCADRGEGKPDYQHIVHDVMKDNRVFGEHSRDIPAEEEENDEHESSPEQGEKLRDFEC